MLILFLLFSLFNNCICFLQDTDQTPSKQQNKPSVTQQTITSEMLVIIIISSICIFLNSILTLIIEKKIAGDDEIFDAVINAPTTTIEHFKTSFLENRLISYEGKLYCYNSANFPVKVYDNGGSESEIRGSTMILNLNYLETPEVPQSQVNFHDLDLIGKHKNLAYKVDIRNFSYKLKGKNKWQETNEKLVEKRLYLAPYNIDSRFSVEDSFIESLFKNGAYKRLLQLSEECKLFFAQELKNHPTYKNYQLNLQGTKLYVTKKHFSNFASEKRSFSFDKTDLKIKLYTYLCSEVNNINLIGQLIESKFHPFKSKFYSNGFLDYIFCCFATFNSIIIENLSFRQNSKLAFIGRLKLASMGVRWGWRMLCLTVTILCIELLQMAFINFMGTDYKGSTLFHTLLFSILYGVSFHVFATGIMKVLHGNHSYFLHMGISVSLLFAACYLMVKL